MGKGLGISVISTVLNEEETIGDLLRSLLAQTLKPKEVVIVDGGSKDATVKVIESYKKAFEEAGIKLKVIVAKGASVGEGRNIAVRNTSCKLIASIDGGCIATRFWLKELYKTYEETKADVVSGNFLPLARSFQEEIQACFVKISSKENPSHRSVLYTKEVFKAVGGYPDRSTGEDTFFNLKAKALGFKFAFAPKAIVYWRMRKSLKSWLKQFYRYGKGDGMLLLPGFDGYRLKITLTLLFFPTIPLYPLISPFFAVYWFLKKKKPVCFIAGFLYPLRIYAYAFGYLRGFLCRRA